MTSSSQFILPFLLVLTDMKKVAVTEEKVVKIGLMYSGQSSVSWPGGYTALPTAVTAIQLISNHNFFLTHNMTFELYPVDSLCDAEQAYNVGKQLLENPDIPIIVGPPCSLETDNSISFFSHQFFNESVYQTPFLVATARFDVPLTFSPVPIFKRLIPEDAHYSFRPFFDHFGWNRFSIIYDQFNLARLEGMKEVLVGFDVAAFIFFDDSLSLPQVERSLQVLNDKKINIFWTIVYSGVAKMVCAAEKIGLYTLEQVWIVPRWMWATILGELPQFCTEAQIDYLKTADGPFDLYPIAEEELGEDLDVARNYSGFLVDYASVVRELGLPYQLPSIFDIFLYDCVWAAAYALTNTLLHNPNSGFAFSEIMSMLDNFEFYGLSGKVGFDGKSSLYPKQALFQFEHWTGEPVKSYRLSGRL